MPKMYQYEAYLNKAENCIKKAKEFSGDVRLVAFYTNAAKGFTQRAARLTLAEAMSIVDAEQILTGDTQ
jgi:hypothetical protein